jgi:cell fate regulator YaaT (PSP1 superfamily)
MQKVVCEFSEGGRQYSYDCDIDVNIGDDVEVETKNGVKTVKIVGFTTKEFPFPLKKVIGKATPKVKAENKLQSTDPLDLFIDDKPTQEVLTDDELDFFKEVK